MGFLGVEAAAGLGVEEEANRRRTRPPPGPEGVVRVAGTRRQICPRWGRRNRGIEVVVAIVLLAVWFVLFVRLGRELAVACCKGGTVGWSAIDPNPLVIAPRYPY